MRTHQRLLLCVFAAACGGRIDTSDPDLIDTADAAVAIDGARADGNGGVVDSGVDTGVDTGHYGPGGRRVVGSLVCAKQPHPLAKYFAEMTAFEAASVPAFRRMQRELTAHRAPRALVRAAARSERDEIRHARTMSSWTRRTGGTPARARIARFRKRSFEAFAIENAVEGCVFEACGALLNCHQARAARSPALRKTFGAIARDEIRHAALALAVDEWARARLDASALDRIRTATAAAFAKLEDELEKPAPAFARDVGLPPPQVARALIAELRAATG